MRLYHFTDYDSYCKIKKKRILRASDSINGKGVFFTSKNPNEHSIEVIANSCFRKGAKKRLDEKKLDYYFEIDVGTDDMNNLFESVINQEGSDDAHIYRHKKDLHLEKFTWECGAVDEWDIGPYLKAGAGAIAAASVLGHLISKGMEIRSNYIATETKKKERLKMVEQRLLNIMSKFHRLGADGSTHLQFNLVKQVDETKGYGFFGSPKGHIMLISCSACQTEISEPFPLEERTLEIINECEDEIISELERHKKKCDWLTMLKGYFFSILAIAIAMMIYAYERK
mmetsp:Transcript_15099/g.28419  ORF Transcript_15099/g.28419 Transcript_15099/m.28419 type:complete len:284 (+) Transcript_15099:227-1078(+)|eukprot:CAMPEP_0176477040 /NCGR_PEP_ID=MMETSP0200_2-20121128/395_1 /TAXON_ID=947934 /ORGANISM="Chaetoceros sp., Strain GSL56" /LENGTH=283 /DNA_ID=CAMNT_0017872793 /DNA_START=255 /DNA_END=1106 /DNA_ORIENTATION=-